MKTNTIVYISYFKYNDDASAERFYGHPKQGGVYKALKVGDVYKIPLRSRDNVQGIVLDKRVHANHDEPGKWEFELSEVTEDNLIHLNISLNDLQLIQKEWEDDYNDLDMKEEEEERTGNSEDQEEKIFRAFQNMTEYLNIIVDGDKDLFFTLVDVVEEISGRFNVITTEEGLLKQSIIDQIVELKNRK